MNNKEVLANLTLTGHIEVKKGYVKLLSSLPYDLLSIDVS